jgi:hypothetical protein
MRFALYAGTMSPMFFVGTLGGWLQNTSLGWILLISHWLGAFILGQLSRFVFKCAPVPESTANKQAAAPNLMQVMSSAAMTMFTVCGLMVLGSVAAKMVQCAFPNLPEMMLVTLQSFLEVTSGCSRILSVSLPYQVPALRPALLCAAASFSGLSILLQNMAFLQERKVSFVFLVMGRFCHALISFGLCLLLFPLAGNASAPAYAQISDIPKTIPYIFLGVWFLSLLLMKGKPQAKKTAIK